MKALQHNRPASNGQPANGLHTNLIPCAGTPLLWVAVNPLRGFSINQAGARQAYPIFKFLQRSFRNFRSLLAQRRLGVVLFQDSEMVYSSIRRMHLFKINQDSPAILITPLTRGVGPALQNPGGPHPFRRRLQSESSAV